MRRETLIKNLLFDVDPVPFEAVVRDCPTLGSGHLPPSRTIHCIPQLRPHDRRQSMILTSVRSLSMDTDQSTLALNTVLRLPEAKPEDKKARAEGLHALSLDLSTRLKGYQKELDPNTLIRLHLMFVLPFWQRAAVCLRLSALRSGCLGSHRSLRLSFVRKDINIPRTILSCRCALN